MQVRRIAQYTRGIGVATYHYSLDDEGGPRTDIATTRRRYAILKRRRR